MSTFLSLRLYEFLLSSDGTCTKKKSELDVKMFTNGMKLIYFGKNNDHRQIVFKM